MDNQIRPSKLEALSGRYLVFKTSLSNFLRAVRLIYASASRWTVVWVFLLVIQGLLPVASVYLTRWLVNSLAAGAGAGLEWKYILPVLLPAGLMAGLMILQEVFQATSERVRATQAELIQDHISDRVQVKAVEVDYAYYESAEYYDRLYRATADATSRPLALLESTGSLLQNGITLVGMAAVLFSYGAWLPLLLLVGTFPALIVVLKSNRRYHRWWENTTQDRRWIQYLNSMLIHGAIAAEVRLFDLGPHFRGTFQKLRDRLRIERLQLVSNQSNSRLVAGIIALLISGIAMVWLMGQVFVGILTLGDIALIYQAMNRGQSLLHSLLGNIGQIFANSLFLGNLFEFFDLKPEIVSPPIPLKPSERIKQGIDFRKVTFYYPGSEKPAFQNFDLSIPAGKVVAIVGPNGAGKTTLVKLLCRFYDPQAGCIEVDGIDIRDLEIKELRRRISVLFQIPVSYSTTAGQNIAMGDLHRELDLDEIELAAHRAGVHELIAQLPEGYDTLLGKSFANGIELSTGEWQRLALARAYVRQAPIIILDEPTSFLDSWTEAEWFDKFRELAYGRVAILITHRFTIARRADLIYVMNKGQIVESGTHAELLAEENLYAKSWNTQLNPEQRESVYEMVHEFNDRER